MIMAGRGRRLTGDGQDTAKPGISPPSPAQPTNLSTVMGNIKELNVTVVNASLLSKIQSGLKELCSTKENMKKVISDLHEKSLHDAEFGEKVVLALEQVCDFEVDDTLLRNELLSFIQNDFKVKESVFQSDRQVFLNGVSLLGFIYNRIRVCGEPIVILGIALLEYFDLLLKGEEEELKTLAKQVDKVCKILLNGANLSKINRYELLVYELRKILTNEVLTSKSKCWILLAIDFISNEWKPLKGIIRNFYVANLGEEYKKLESLVSNDKTNSVTSPNSVKCSENLIEKKNKTDFNSSRNLETQKKDLSKTFSDINLNQTKGNKVQSPPGQGNKKDNWKSGGGNRKISGHDDRFEKDENYYGVQKPRQPNPRKNTNEGKTNKKGFGNFKPDSDKTAVSQLAEGESNE